MRHTSSDTSAPASQSSRATDSRLPPRNARCHRACSSLLLRTGLSLPALAGQPRRHPVTYRDTAPDGFPDGTQLPVEVPTGGKFRVHLGEPDAALPARAVVGLAERPAMAGSRLAVTINGTPVAPTADLFEPKKLGGAARALAYQIPPAALRPGYNEVAVQQVDHGPAQQIGWVEIRFGAP